VKIDNLLVILIIIFGLTNVGLSFAQTNILPKAAGAQQVDISVTTNKSKYNPGDTIIVSGKISQIIDNTSLAISILNPEGNTTTFTLGFPREDGIFTTTFLNTCGSTWNLGGNYNVRVQYGEYARASLIFYYPGCITPPSNLTNATQSNGTLLANQTEPIRAIPYIFSLTATKSSFHDVKYKIHFNFPNEYFNVARVVGGTFDNFIDLHNNTVIFNANDIVSGQNKTGLVALAFKDNEVKPDLKGTFDVDVTANGTTKSATIDPGIAEIDAIIQTAQNGFNLILNVYNSTVSCFNLNVSDMISGIGTLDPKYSVYMENCSTHPEKVHLSASESNYAFSRNDMDIHSLSEKNANLTIFVPPNLPNGVHTFIVKGDVLFDIFGYKWIVTYSNGTGYYQIQNNAVIPEFPASVVILISIIGVIAVSRNFRFYFEGK
jgi:hypothetical protein